jgi:hypothetical protein
VLKDAPCFRRFAIFRFLLIFPFTRRVIGHFRHGFQAVLDEQDRRMMQLLWNLVKAFGREGDFQGECLLAAVASRKLEVVDFVWNELGIERISLRRAPAGFAREIINSRNPEIIRRFLRFGDIFCGKNSAMNILNKVSASSSVELVKVITGNDPNYFRLSPRNPVPFAESVDILKCLFALGADPAYQSICGKTIVQVAMTGKDPAMLLLLQSVGLARQESTGSAWDPGSSVADADSSEGSQDKFE